MTRGPQAEKEPGSGTRTMVITGTSRGIGRFLRDYYLELGWRVVGCSRSDVDLDSERYRHHALDVDDEEAVVRMIRRTTQEHGRIDALINNAGIASMNHALLTPLDTVRRVFATNVFGTFLFAREVGKAMSRQRSGRIVNFATVATPLRLEGEAAYAASKAAVESLTEILAYELASFNITVNAVGPTPIATDLLRGVPEDRIDDLVAAQAIRRPGEFDDVANVIDFFLQDRSRFVTGQVVYLGGIS